MTAEPTQIERADWREHLRVAADLALIGFAVVIMALPVVTAPAALAAGSAAVDHWLTHDRLPTARMLGGWLARALLPSLVALAVVVVVTVALVADVWAIRSGRVPGGAAAGVLTACAAAALIGLASVMAVVIGRTRCRSWRRAVRVTIGLAARPVVVPAAAGTTLIATLLGWLMPATIPLIVGFGLFALHVLVRRLAPEHH
jgi:hypothetical protein